LKHNSIIPSYVISYFSHHKTKTNAQQYKGIEPKRGWGDLPFNQDRGSLASPTNKTQSNSDMWVSHAWVSA